MKNKFERVGVVPDIHQDSEYYVDVSEALEASKDSFDTIVFLGDYFDTSSHTKTNAVSNPLFLINSLFNMQDWYKEACNINVKLLVGNHDLQYFDSNEKTSDFSQATYDEVHDILMKNINRFDIAYTDAQGIVYSHAGFSKDWKYTIEKRLARERSLRGKLFNLQSFIFHDIEKENKHPIISAKMLDLACKLPDIKKKDIKTIDKKNFVAWCNKTFHHKKFSYFGFTGYEIHGNDSTQTPLWIRPEALRNNCVYKNQIVGHTKYGYNTRYYGFFDKNEDFVLDLDVSEHPVTSKDVIYTVPNQKDLKRIHLYYDDEKEVLYKIKKEKKLFDNDRSKTAEKLKLLNVKYDKLSNKDVYKWFWSFYKLIAEEKSYECKFIGFIHDNQDELITSDELEKILFTDKMPMDLFKWFRSLVFNDKKKAIKLLVIATHLPVVDVELGMGIAKIKWSVD